MSTTITSPDTATTRRGRGAPRSVVAPMLVGLGLTVVALVLPHLDSVTGMLAGHIRAGYPQMSARDVAAGVAFYTVALTVVGALGLVGWTVSLWLAHRTPRWAPVPSSLLWVVATTLAVYALTAVDTSGDTGLPALLGWSGVLPCVAGLVAVVQQWRHRRGVDGSGLA